MVLVLVIVTIPVVLLVADNYDVAKQSVKSDLSEDRTIPEKISYSHFNFREQP